MTEPAQSITSAFVEQAAAFPMVTGLLALACGMLVGPVVAAFVAQLLPERAQRKATTVFVSAVFGALSGLFFLSTELAFGEAMGLGAMGGAAAWWAVPWFRSRLPGAK